MSPAIGRSTSRAWRRWLDKIFAWASQVSSPLRYAPLITCTKRHSALDQAAGFDLCTAAPAPCPVLANGRHEILAAVRLPASEHTSLKDQDIFAS